MAGSLSFVADEAPVVGFDATVPDFFWLAGQVDWVMPSRRELTPLVQVAAPPRQGS